MNAIILSITAECIAPNPLAAIADPAKPPIRVCDEEDGMPCHHVNRFQIIAAITPERITSRAAIFKVELESSEFNRKYHVYASAPEQVTAFELLHPAMMQTLLDAKYNISIEVIGNSIYFYAPMRRTSVATYEEMMRVLQAAYRELKM